MESEQQQEGTASAGNNGTPAEIAGALTGTGKIPPTNTVGWGRQEGLLQTTARESVRMGAIVQEQAPILTWTPAQESREALRQQADPEGWGLT